MKYLALALLSFDVCFASGTPKPLSRTAGANEPAAEAQLPALSADELTPKNHHGLIAIGVGRRVPQREVSRGVWRTLPTGDRVWQVAIHSPGAWGLRLHFSSFHVGSGKVWLYSNKRGTPDEAFAGPYSGKGLFGDGDFWSEPVEGQSVVIEYAPANGAVESNLPFQVDQISHLYSKPLRAAPRSSLTFPTTGPADREINPLAGTDNAAAQNTCSPDVTCFSEWSTAASAVASITFVSGGSSYLCTGSVIEDGTKSGQPLFLTADHCVSDDTTARSVVAHFQYQSSVCNGVLPSYFQVPRVTGAKYLASRPIPQGDFSLLLLASTTPAGTVALPWNGATEPQVGESVIAIHHPGILLDGSAPNGKRISFGQRDYPQTTSVEGDVMPGSVSIAVNWLPGEGYTEPGSSGSPLLSASGKLLGTLTGGVEGPLSSQCNPSYAVAVYGKFAVALTTLSPYVGAPTIQTTPASCSYSLAVSNVTLPASGGPGSFGVNMTAGCAIPANATRDWISASGMQSAQGIGSVSYSASWNPASMPRVAAIQTGSQAVQVLQRGTNTVQDYTDLPSTNPWFDYVEILRNAGIVTGCTATEYCPEQPINRLDMAMFLVRGILGTGTFPYNTTPYFEDVPASSPYFPYVQKLRELGITSGCNVTPALYCPAMIVTRAQMAKFLISWKVGDNFQYTTSPYFDDVPPSHWVYKYIQKMRDLGITSGCGTRIYCPDADNTRGQISVFLTRSFLSGAQF